MNNITYFYKKYKNVRNEDVIKMVSREKKNNLLGNIEFTNLIMYFLFVNVFLEEKRREERGLIRN